MTTFKETLKAETIRVINSQISTELAKVSAEIRQKCLSSAQQGLFLDRLNVEFDETLDFVIDFCKQEGIRLSHTKISSGGKDKYQLTLRWD